MDTFNPYFAVPQDILAYIGFVASVRMQDILQINISFFFNFFKLNVVDLQMNSSIVSDSIHAHTHMYIYICFEYIDQGL